MTITKRQIVQKGCGHVEEYTVATGVTLKPGMGVQLNSSGELVLGCGAADGERSLVMIVKEDNLLGKTVSDTYAAGSVCRVYVPQPGDELLLLVSDTADAVVVGDKYINDVSTGEWIETTGTVEMEPFVALEAGGTLAADALLLAKFSG